MEKVTSSEDVNRFSGATAIKRLKNKNGIKIGVSSLNAGGVDSSEFKSVTLPVKKQSFPSNDT